MCNRNPILSNAIYLTTLDNYTWFNYIRNDIDVYLRSLIQNIEYG